MTALAAFIGRYGAETVSFMLVFGRALGLMVGAPFWGGRALPVVVRIWVALLLAVAVFPSVPAASVADLTVLALVLFLGGEILLGLTLGWTAQVLFAGMRLAGQQIEVKSGLGLVSLVDPHEGGHSGIFAVFLELAAGLIFLALDGHLQLVQALLSSYAVFPPAGTGSFAGRLLEGVVASGTEIFAIALRVSAPVLVGLLLSDIVLGVLSRAIPQMNVFMVAQPLQFGVALLLLMLSLPALAWLIARQLAAGAGFPAAAG
ncbi:MAG TPA: flagellar biosynthetic protein FliR [candidate division Zixibacteria bacterium]|nr:flagellar biosynthetic protein FliR [candidate division Zixibacteria bacterium]